MIKDIVGFLLNVFQSKKNPKSLTELNTHWLKSLRWKVPLGAAAVCQSVLNLGLWSEVEWGGAWGGAWGGGLTHSPVCVFRSRPQTYFNSLSIVDQAPRYATAASLNSNKHYSLFPYKHTVAC